MAPISVIAQPFAGEAPVVSKSRTMKVTSESDPGFSDLSAIFMQQW
jgi:hypothetical protein